MARLKEERIAELKRHAENGTNDATPTEIEQLIVEYEHANAQWKAAGEAVVREHRSVKELTADLEAAQKENKQYEEDVEMLNRTLGDTNDGCVELEKNLEATQEALSGVLDIIDGPEMSAELSIAYSHGYKCDKEVSKRNGAIIDAAYKLLGRERSKGGG